LGGACRGKAGVQRLVDGSRCGLESDGFGGSRAGGGRSCQRTEGGFPRVEVLTVDDATAITVGREVGRRTDRALPLQKVGPIGVAVVVIVASSLADIAQAKYPRTRLDG
jgi:hypothetical protein